MITGYKPSAHMINDRENRLVKISSTIGFGDELGRFPHPKCADRAIVLTTTGVIMIVSKDTIITMYAADVELLIALYKGNPPRAIRNQVIHNRKKYPQLWRE